MTKKRILPFDESPEADVQEEQKPKKTKAKAPKKEPKEPKAKKPTAKAKEPVEEVIRSPGEIEIGKELNKVIIEGLNAMGKLEESTGNSFKVWMRY